MSVPIASVGSIMGPGGSIMRELREKSQCLIVLQQKSDMQPGQRRREVYLSGDKLQIVAARKLLGICVARDAVRGSSGRGRADRRGMKRVKSMPSRSSHTSEFVQRNTRGETQVLAPRQGETRPLKRRGAFRLQTVEADVSADMDPFSGFVSCEEEEESDEGSSGSGCESDDCGDAVESSLIRVVVSGSREGRAARAPARIGKGRPPRSSVGSQTAQGPDGSLGFSVDYARSRSSSGAESSPGKS
jgi:hypothetical protein